MDPELVALILVLAAGTSSWFARARAPAVWDVSLSGLEIERRARRALLRPLLPVGCAAMFVTGWALFEPPVADEVPPPSLILIAGIYALVVVRATVRLVRAAGARPEIRTAAVVGLWRPYVIIAPSFDSQLDAEAREAVLEHEAAHARAYDPLRFLVAQLVTDLQWPSRSARARLHAWRSALEIARDEDARQHGADGAALASAILHAARGASESEMVPGVSRAVDSAVLQLRISRLLAPVRRAPPRSYLYGVWTLGAVAIVALGAWSGDPVLGTICAVLP